MTSPEEQTSTPHADAAASAPTKKPRRAAQRVQAVPPKVPAGRKARHGKPSTTRPKKARSVRKGTKTAKILALLERPRGASVKEIIKATGWQAHSVRGFLSGVVSKQMGLKLRTAEGDSGVLRYAVNS